MTRPLVGDLIPFSSGEGRSGYERPSDWLEMPTLEEGQQKIVCLYAVFDHDSNFVSFQIDGAYTVDWGDGNQPENFASGDNANHRYNYSDIEPNSYCSRGYRQVIITVTPQPGNNLTFIDFTTVPDVLHEDSLDSDKPKRPSYFLDIRMAGEYVNQLQLSSYEEYETQTTQLKYVEVFEYVGEHQIDDLSFMFAGMEGLQSVKIDTSGKEDLVGLFVDASSLRYVPELDTSQCVNFQAMFAGCESLIECITIDTSNGMYFAGMFSGCISLEQTPEIDTKNGVDFEEMFIYCRNLKTLRFLDTSKGENFKGMFNSTGIVAANLYNTSNGTNFQAMFNECIYLQSVSGLDCSNSGMGNNNYISMFNRNYSLSKVDIVGIRNSISFSRCKLSRQEIINIFNNLGQAEPYSSIDVEFTWGCNELTQEDIAIAEDKGWEVHVN